MNELHNNEQLATANVVSLHRSVATEAEMVEDCTSFPSSRVRSEPTQPNALFPLFLHDEFESFRSRWRDVQTSFVDEPQTAVELADNLVANVITRITEQFAAEREDLEKQWDRGENVNTEDLRQAFKRYRAFFDRLLTF
jgi:hypothetical protein